MIDGTIFVELIPMKQKYTLFILLLGFFALVISPPCVFARSKNLIPDSLQVIHFQVNNICFDMQRVEGGVFVMGGTPEQHKEKISTDLPTHTVSLDAYYIASTEVTQALWNAVMINALEILVNSPNGTMMGMDSVASPELDGIRNDSGKYSRYVSRINRMELAPDSAISPQFKMVSVIKPEFMITVIPRDMAMINATPNRSDAPRTKPSMSSCSRIRVATPTIMPATRNSPDSSVKYQPSVGKKVMPKSLNGITE